MGFSRQEYWSGVPLPSTLLLLRHFYYGLHNYSANALPERLLKKRYLKERTDKLCFWASSNHSTALWIAFLSRPQFSNTWTVGLDLFGWLDVFDFFVFQFCFSPKSSDLPSSHTPLYWKCTLHYFDIKECLWEVSLFWTSLAILMDGFHSPKCVCKPSQLGEGGDTAGWLRVQTSTWSFQFKSQLYHKLTLPQFPQL